MSFHIIYVTYHLHSISQISPRRFEPCSQRHFVTKTSRKFTVTAGLLLSGPKNCTETSVAPIWDLADIPITDILDKERADNFSRSDIKYIFDKFLNQCSNT